MKRVLVTGATGKTGSLVLQKLRDEPDKFETIGLARSPIKAEELFDSTEGFVIGDIKDKSSLNSAIEGSEALVILTSAVPKIIAPPPQGQRPEFEFVPGGLPEEIDWLGQKNQIDAAKQAGVAELGVDNRG